MALEDNIRKRMQRRKDATQKSEEDIIKEQVKDFNYATQDLINDFMRRVVNGEVSIDNIPDFIRMWGAFQETNNLKDMMEYGTSGESAPPALNLRQKRRLEQFEEEGKVEVEEDASGEEYINLENLSDDDLGEFIADTLAEKNRQNENRDGSNG